MAVDRAQAKRDAEKARREEMKNVVVAFADHGAELPGGNTVTAAKRLDASQRARALDAPAGIRKEMFRRYVIEGKTPAEQRAEAVQSRQTEKAVDRRLGRSPKDPEAAELAARAKASVPSIKSKFRSYEMRQLLDEFEIAKPKVGTIVVARGNNVNQKGARTIVEFTVGDLIRFRDGGDFERKTEMRKQIAELTDGLKLWGRKFAAAVLVKADQ